MNSGGDVLARGAKSAQFSAGGSAVNDEVELHNVAPEELGSGITVIDKRSRFDSEPVKMAEPKYPEKEYGQFTPILDRVLVKRVSYDPDEELLEDGSTKNKKTGLITAAKYRQHSSVGIVLATGKFVILGGVKVSMSEVVRPGDWAMWGDYNSEVMNLPEDKIRELCDNVKLDYIEDPDGLRIVRVQDIRGIKQPVKDQNYV